MCLVWCFVCVFVLFNPSSVVPPLALRACARRGYYPRGRAFLCAVAYYVCMLCMIMIIIIHVHA